MLDSLSVPRRAYDFEDYVDILRRNLRWIIAPAFAGLVISTVVAYSMDDSYFSVAKIRVTPQQITPDLVKSITSQDVADRINSMALTIESRNTLTNIINTYGLYKKDLKSEPLDDVLDKMKHSIYINASGGAEASGKLLPVMDVGFFYTDKYTAQKVCAELVSRFTSLSSSDVAQSQQEAGQFINDEFDQAKRDLDDLSKKLNDFRAEHAGRLPEEAQLNMQQLNALDGQLGSLNEAANRNDQQRMMLETNLNIAKARLSSIHSPQSQAQNEKLASFDRQIEAAENNIAALKERYTDDYPDLQSAKDQLAFLKRQRDAAAKEKPKPVEAPVDNADVTRERIDSQGVIDQLQSQMKGNAMDAKQIARDMASVNAAIRVYQARLSGTANEKEYADLLREHELAKQRYFELNQKREKSVTSQHMEQRKQGETLELLDPASLPVSPFAPKRAKIIPIGAVIGFVLGVVLVGVREVRDTSLKNLKDARLYTQLSILGSVPLLENDIVVQRRKQVMWVGWATATIAGLAIIAGSVARYYLTRG